MLGQTVGAHLRERRRGKSYQFVCHAVVCLKIGFVNSRLNAERSSWRGAVAFDMSSLVDHRYLGVAPLEKSSTASSWTRALCPAQASRLSESTPTGLSAAVDKSLQLPLFSSWVSSQRFAGKNHQSQFRTNGNIRKKQYKGGGNGFFFDISTPDVPFWSIESRSALASRPKKRIKS